LGGTLNETFGANMKSLKFAVVLKVIASALILQGCFESDTDKKPKSSSGGDPAMNQRMYDRGLAERRCDFIGGTPAEVLQCWKSVDDKFKSTPSAYTSAPPAGFERTK
jgi:hypothetical protein